MSAGAQGQTGTVVRNYKDLQVWQKGMELAIDVYRLTRDFPSDGKFGLVSQMRRAAVSVPSIVAEGQARNTGGKFVQFISHLRVRWPNWTHSYGWPWRWDFANGPMQSLWAPRLSRYRRCSRVFAGN